MEISSNSSSTTRPHIIVVSGLGGIGKTQLVRKFIKNNLLLYTNVIWISSEKFELIVQSLKTLATHEFSISLTHDDGREKEFRSIVGQVMNKLSQTRTLLVNDNVDRIEDVKFLLTIETSGEKPHFIITSRIREWGDGIDIIHLDAWTVPDAIEYVSKTLNAPTDSGDDKKLLVKRLQAFPLALRQATVYTNFQRKERHFRIADYVQNYHTQEMLDCTLFQRDILNIYERTTLTTWRVTIDAIERDKTHGPLAARILQIIAYFDPENIHRNIFFPYFTDDSEEHVRAAIRLLVNYSMIDCRENQSVLNVHRLVQQVIKLELQKPHREALILKDGLMLISKLMESDRFNESCSHAISIFLSALKFDDLVKEFGSLPRAIFANLVELGTFDRAKAFGDEILPPFAIIFGDSHAKTLETTFVAAHSYKQLGMHSRALGMYQDVVEKRTNVLGEDHPDTLTSKFSTAYPYRQLGMHTEALSLYHEVFEKWTNNFGADHAKTVTCKANIAFSYKQLGMHSRALELYQEVFVKRKNILGEDHPETLITEFNVAESYRALGMTAKAAQMYPDVLVKWENFMGEDHPDTLIFKGNIAFAYKELGMYAKALEMYKEVFEKEKNILGEDHPDTLMGKSNIADLYGDLGMYTAALRMSQEVYDDMKTVLGHDHPETLASKLCIAYSCKELGMKAEALQIYRDVFEKERINLGEDHPHNLITKSNIALLLGELGRYSEALQMSDKMFEKIREDHPNTLQIQSNIAALYRELGMTTEALEMFENIFEIQKEGFRRRPSPYANNRIEHSSFIR